jgi:hypothetical protein
MRQDATLDQEHQNNICLTGWAVPEAPKPPDIAKLRQHSQDPLLGICDALSRRPMASMSVNTSPKLQEERKAAENAKAILGTLTPSPAGTDRTIFALRYAANLAKRGTLARLESRYALDGVRVEAANALNAVCRLLDRGHVPQDGIDQATNAIVAWLEALPS